MKKNTASFLTLSLGNEEVEISKKWRAVIYIRQKRQQLKGADVRNGKLDETGDDKDRKENLKNKKNNKTENVFFFPKLCQVIL